MISSHQFASKFRYAEDRPSDKVSSNEANQKLEILEVHNQDGITVSKTWSEGATEVGHIGPTQVNLETKFSNWYVEWNTPQNLHTYLRSGEFNRSLIVNRKEDREIWPEYPYGVVYKLYQPLANNIQAGDFVYVTTEMSSPYEENVKLLDFVDESTSTVTNSRDIWNQSDVEEDCGYREVC